jgi:hypothetical protein
MIRTAKNISSHSGNDLDREDVTTVALVPVR